MRRRTRRHSRSTRSRGSPHCRIHCQSNDTAHTSTHPSIPHSVPLLPSPPLPSLPSPHPNLRCAVSSLRPLFGAYLRVESRAAFAALVKGSARQRSLTVGEGNDTRTSSLSSFSPHSLCCTVCAVLSLSLFSHSPLLCRTLGSPHPPPLSPTAKPSPPHPPSVPLPLFLCHCALSLDPSTSLPPHPP